MWATDSILRLWIVALIWGTWCVQHSLLNSEGPLRRTSLLDSKLGAHYRLFYNVVAVLTLVLVSKLTPRGHEFSIVVWHWPLKLVPVLVWTIGLLVFWLTFRCLGWWDFLGFRGTGRDPDKQVRSGRSVITWGIYGVMRHPQFSAGLMLLWMRDLRDTDLVINVVLSAYLLVGAHLEERRLIRRFGEEYIRYRRNVPAFVPTRVPRLRELLR